MFPTPEWDLTLFRLINGSWRNEVLDFAMPIISSSYMVLLFIVPIVVLAALQASKRREMLTALIIIAAVVGTTEFTVNIIKETSGRVRPYKALPLSHYYDKKAAEWEQRPADYVQSKKEGSSFVSAHAANSIAISVILALIWPKVRSFIWLIPLLVGYSRIYLAKHYPMDVLGGWVVGFTIAYLLWKTIMFRFVPIPEEDRVIRLNKVYS